jgi:hypothetical protein
MWATLSMRRDLTVLRDWLVFDADVEEVGAELARELFYGDAVESVEHQAAKN